MLDQESKPAKEGIEILPFEMHHLPEFFKQKAEMEINYSTTIVESTLKKLKELISNDDILKEARIKDEVLVVFLMCRKFNVEQAFQHLRKYNSFYKSNLVMFTTPSFDVLSIFVTSGFISVLPWRCQDGCTLVYIQLAKRNPELHSVTAIKQFYAFLMLQSVRMPMTQVNGYKAIIDFDLSWETMKICTPQNMYLFVYGILVICPARFKAVHILNMTVVGRLLWQITTPFLPGKIKKRVHFHKSNDTLLEYFPNSVLPHELGGDLKDYALTEWVRKYSSPEETSVFQF